MNISSIKTPGVYINEIDAFPQSVAQVATAIPAFIGYTQSALTPNVPTRIVSLLEYNQYFGGAPEPDSITVDLDINNIPTDATTVAESKYKLYNSLQLFYANGGGECYIVSIGTYVSAIAEGDFLTGIEAIENFDEPTLLLFPDAVNLSAASLGTVQKTALLQCQDLMDRFVIMDVKMDIPVGQTKADLEDDTLNFRDAIGTQSLKYGAAYYPYLITNFANQFSFSAINTAISGGFKRFSPNDTVLNASIDKYLYVANTVDTLKGSWEDPTLSKIINAEMASNTNVKTNLDIVWKLLGVLGNPDSVTNADFKNHFNQTIEFNLLQYAKRLADFRDEYISLKKDATGTTVVGPVNLAAVVLNGGWGTNPTTTTNNPNSYLNKLSNVSVIPSTTTEFKEVDYSKVQAELERLLKQIIPAIDAAFGSFNNYQAYQEGILTPQIPMYAIIVAKLNQSLNTTPPSGAIAGVYAQTDATRGVWKAPANISLNGIIGLTDDINDREQGPMNIHETGKSINAIRKFTGQGFIVWGGRTLDGNSNDWRYINVRRLANMIEESIKKACNHYVFEPNVSQTWVNVKGMIENYLATIWSDGGLAGAKPEQAFFVAVGLNQTMTAQDINEGRMIVKVGYAPSRPAEFIIVEFKQMLQQS